jgi:hypothetical protein
MACHTVHQVTNQNVAVIQNVAAQRGSLVRRRTEHPITHAEAYQRIFSATVREL